MKLTKNLEIVCVSAGDKSPPQGRKNYLLYTVIASQTLFLWGCVLNKSKVILAGSWV